MNYPFILKFSSISNLSDARYAAGMWADFIGFNFDPNSSSYIDPEKAKSIIGWISGTAIVGEFGQQPIEWIKDFSQQLQLQVVQIPADYMDMTIFQSGLKTIVLAKDGNDSSTLSHADILLTDNLSLYHQLIERYNKPVIFQTTTLTEDASYIQGIAIQGEPEDQPGTRNQGDWTAYLEQYGTDN